MKPSTEFIFHYFVLIIGLGILIISIAGFYTGFHNVDLMFNLLKIHNEEGDNYDNCFDMYNKDGDLKGCAEFYILGQDYMLICFFLVLLAGLMIGASIINITYLFDNESKRNKGTKR